MKKLIIAGMAAACVAGAGCKKENKVTERGDANEMFARICRLTEEYTGRLRSAPDSADWAAVCSEYEEKLDKISFSYPPDTDLLLTEGQNDTIHTLMQEYAKERKNRLHGIMHPKVEIDSLNASDSLFPEKNAQ